MTTIINTQYKKIKHFIYKKKVDKTKFSKKEFQKARKTKALKKLLDDMNKISTCLNDKKVTDITPEDKVCLVIMNTYKKNNNALGTGPLNDGYEISKLYKSRGYKIFFLHDTSRDDFLNFVCAFLEKTKVNLTIFYSGRCTTVYEHHKDDTAIVFNAGHITGCELDETLAKKANKKVKVVLICDCFTGGSIWSLNFDGIVQSSLKPNIVSIFSVYNSTIPNMIKKAQKMHGIFTYYFCKYANEMLDVSPINLLNNLNPPLERFNISLMCISTNNTLESQPIF